MNQLRPAIFKILLFFVCWFSGLPTLLALDAVVTSTNQPAREIVKFGDDVTLPEGETCRKISVISGSAKIDGTVEHDVTVVSGSAIVNGRIEGSLLVVRGAVTLGPNAFIGHDLTVVGGPLTIAPGARIVGKKVDITTGGKMPLLARATDWFATGLLLGRPLPHRLGWVWIVAGIFLLFNVAVQLLFPRPVQACMDAMEQRPIGSLFTGFWVFILFGPLLLLLLITKIGILIIPLLLFAMLAALLLGKVAVYGAAGQRLGKEFKLAALQSPIAALAAGTLLFYFLYTIPIVGLLAWGMITLAGVGAVFIATVTGWRRENEKEKPPVTATATTAATATAAEAPAAAVPPPLLSFDPSALPRVGFWLRLLAMMIDLALILVAAGITHTLPLVPLYLGAYHIGMWGSNGATIGGIVLGLKIVRPNGRRIDWTVAIVRALASVVSALVLGLGFFWAGWSRDKQSWHDKIADTIVVKIPKGLSPL